jgi:transcriptional regulator with XRE-family HTH domain
MIPNLAPDPSPPDASGSDPDVPSRVVPEVDPAVLAARLKWLIGSEPVASFARRCGLSEAVLRSYITDHRMPPLNKALAIANTAGVSLDWLATGQRFRTASKRAADAMGSGDADPAGESARPPLEVAVLEGIVKAVLEAQGARATPAELATRIVDLYQRAMATDPAP